MHAYIRERNLFSTSVDAPSATAPIDEMNASLGTLSTVSFSLSRDFLNFQREKEKQSRGGKQMFSWHWSSISPAACSSTLSQWLLKSATARRETGTLIYLMNPYGTHIEYSLLRKANLNVVFFLFDVVIDLALFSSRSYLWKVLHSTSKI